MSILTIISLVIGIPSGIVFTVALRNWLRITKSDREQKRKEREEIKYYQDHIKSMERKYRRKK